MRRAGTLVALMLALTFAGVTRASISFTNLGGGGCSANCTLTGATTVDALLVDGTAPTCAVTGAGAGAQCVIDTGSTSSAGIATITSDGSGTAATGTLTITFAAALGVAEPVCVANLRNMADTGASWLATSTIRQAESSSTSACVFAWATGGAALATSDQFGFAYIAVGK